MDSSSMLRSAALLMLAAPLLMSAQRVDAQAGNGKVMEEVIVVAPRMVRRETLGRTANGADVERITLTRRVSYSDLDLSRHADVLELENRVNTMAVTACGQLEELFPLSTDERDNAECIRHAKASAMAQVESAAEAAE